jgi:hypothetical protein
MAVNDYQVLNAIVAVINLIFPRSRDGSISFCVNDPTNWEQEVIPLTAFLFRFG